MGQENHKLLYTAIFIAGERVEVLLDSGATHSYISEKLVKALNLGVRDASPQ
jgi:predicted aspartyl protease